MDKRVSKSFKSIFKNFYPNLDENECKLEAIKRGTTLDENNVVSSINGKPPRCSIDTGNVFHFNSFVNSITDCSTTNRCICKHSSGKW